MGHHKPAGSARKELEQSVCPRAFPVLGAINTGAQCPGALSGPGSTDSAANFLCPTGTLASQQSSVTVNFKPPPSNAAIQTQLTETGGEIQVINRLNCNVATTTSFGATAISTTFSATGTCPTNGATNAYWAINNPSRDPTFRLGQLRAKTPNGVQFYLNQTYRTGNYAPRAS